MLMLWSTLVMRLCHGLCSQRGWWNPWPLDAIPQPLYGKDGGHGMFSGFRWQAADDPAPSESTPYERPVWFEVVEQPGGLGLK